MAKTRDPLSRCAYCCSEHQETIDREKCFRQNCNKELYLRASVQVRKLQTKFTIVDNELFVKSFHVFSVHHDWSGIELRVIQFPAD